MLGYPPGKTCQPGGGRFERRGKQQQLLKNHKPSTEVCGHVASKQEQEDETLLVVTGVVTSLSLLGRLSAHLLVSRYGVDVCLQTFLEKMMSDQLL